MLIFVLIAHAHTIAVVYSLYKFVDYISDTFLSKQISIPGLNDFRFLDWTSLD